MTLFCRGSSPLYTNIFFIILLEHEPNYTTLWTYTEQYIYTNNTADEVCKLARNQTSTYSWNSGNTVRLKCEELKFHTLPA
jgi:hypothetical protein